MKNKILSLATLLLFTLCLTISNDAKASHLAGADLTYEQVGPNTYYVTVTHYRDCAGIPAYTSTDVTATSSCGGNSIFTFFPIAGTGQEITTPCPSVPTTCLGGTAPGIQKWQYADTIVLPDSCDWVLSSDECCRNAAVTNLVGTSQSMYIDANLNNSVNNNSPYFTNDPILFLCLNQTFTYNHGAIDPEGDSLYYSFIDPMTSLGAPIPFAPGHSTTQPITSTPGMTLDPNSGSLTITPNALQVSVMAIRVDEYRAGVYMGSVMRDLQVYVSNCSNNLPFATGPVTNTVCAGSNICFTIASGDADSLDNVTMSWNSGISGATFNVTGSPRPVGVFCWTPSAGDEGVHYFTVTVTDDACPTVGTQVFTYAVYVYGANPNVSVVNGGCGGLGSASVSGSFIDVLWSTGDSTNSISGLSSGSYWVTVVDSSGCTGTDSFYVSNYGAMYVTDSINHGTCDSSCNGSIDLYATGGDGSYSYVWSTGETTSSIYGVCSGIYTVTVTDGSGCVYTDSFMISGSSGIDISYVITDESCPGACDGVYDITVTGGSAPYSYVWSNGTTLEDATGLCPGLYTVTVTDANGCTAYSCWWVRGADSIDITYTKGDESCPGACDGWFDISVTGGTAPYSYQWSTGDTTEDVSGLCPGIYPVTVTDANGCTAYLCWFIFEADSMEVSFTKGNETCPGACDGWIDMTITGGVAPYTYNWSTGATTQDVSGLCPGIYPVTITDANGCTAYLCEIISAGTPITVNVTGDDPSCNGECDGIATAIASGGTAPYNITWSNGATGITASDLCAGTYIVDVVDANGCTGTGTVVLTDPAPIYLAKTVKDESCNCTGCDGEVDLHVLGGAAPYTYNWSNGATTQDLTNLCAGFYEVTVTDANGCTATMCVTVDKGSMDISSHSNDVSCHGSCDGSAGVVASGGVAPYSYTWSHGCVLDYAGGLCAGTYTVTVEDAAGCTEVVTFVINEPAPLNVGGTTTNSSHFSTCNGAVDLTVSGGTAPYSYAWSNGSTSEDVSGLCIGTYTVVITDANGCSEAMSFSIRCGASTTGISEDVIRGNIKLNVFPNPTADFIRVRGKLVEEGKYSLELMDVTGKSVFNKSSDNDDINEDINVTDLAPGTYMLYINVPDGQVTEKIEIIH